MRAFTKLTIAVVATALSSCQTAPPVMQAPPPPAPVAKQELPYRWTTDIPETGETKVVIDTLTQLFYVYRDDKLVGVATVSTGKKGRATPLGFWSVMNKQVKGYSRKYDNAPMPFMQMYDPKGIAFHAGPNPGYPASHGCVRLPLKFAERLYGLTKVGSKVIIEG